MAGAIRTVARKLTGTIAAIVAVSCGGPTAPTKPPDPPTSGPAISCPAPTTAASTSLAGASVSFTVPTATGGKAPVAVTCAPASGQVFQVGTTTVQCTATDAASVTGTCAFTVTVTAPPRLARTRFLAFGDSITSGEVTVPITTTGGPIEGRGTILQYVLVPSAAYPTVLNTHLSQRYVAQSISMVNAGRPGETAADAVPRFVATMNANQPEVVLLLMGYNDISIGVRGLPRAVAALEQMAKEARARGARVFVATLTPTIPGRLRSEPTDVLLAYNEAIRNLAFGEGAVLVDLHDAVLPNVNSWIGVDGLHPTEAGYARMAETFAAAIQSELEVR